MTKYQGNTMKKFIFDRLNTQPLVKQAILGS